MEAKAQLLPLYEEEKDNVMDLSEGVNTMMRVKGTRYPDTAGAL